MAVISLIVQAPEQKEKSLMTSPAVVHPGGPPRCRRPALDRQVCRNLPGADAKKLFAVVTDAVVGE